MDKGSAKSPAHSSRGLLVLRGHGFMPSRPVTLPGSDVARHCSAASRPVLRACHVNSLVSQSLLNSRSRLPTESANVNFFTAVARLCSNFKLFPVVYAESMTDVQSEGNVNTPEVTEEEIDKYLANETARQRLEDFFYKKIEYHSHPRKAFLVRTVTAISISVFLVAGLTARIETKEKFVEKYKGRPYISQYNASRTLSNAGMLAFLTRGMSAAFKAAIFLTFFLGTPMVIAIYRNETRLTDYIVTGAGIFALSKLHLGPRGMLAGGIIGAGMGLMQGGLVCGAISAGIYPTQEKFHRKYTRSYLKVEKKFAPPPEYRQRRKPAAPEEPPSFDEQGLIPLNERGRRVRKAVRTFFGLAQITDKQTADTKPTWVKTDSGWVAITDAHLESDSSKSRTE